MSTIQSFSVVAGEALAKGRAILGDGTYADNATAAAIGFTAGVSASGDLCPVVTCGVQHVESSGSIDAGEFVQATTDGKVVAAASDPAAGARVLGVALADAAGGLVCIQIGIAPYSVVAP